MRRLSKAIDAAISRARRLTRARGSPELVEVHASAIRSSAITVTRSPLPTEAAVRSASIPNAVTFTHRVMPSPPGTREGRSRASRSSTPVVPSRVVKVRGSSPRRPVTVTVIGFMGFLPGAVTGRAGRPGGGPGLRGPSRRSDVRAARKGNGNRPAGLAKMFPSGPKKEERRRSRHHGRPRPGKDLWPCPRRAQREAGCGPDDAAQADQSREGRSRSPDTTLTSPAPATLNGVPRPDQHPCLIEQGLVGAAHLARRQQAGEPASSLDNDHYGE